MLAYKLRPSYNPKGASLSLERRSQEMLLLLLWTCYTVSCLFLDCIEWTMTVSHSYRDAVFLLLGISGIAKRRSLGERADAESREKEVMGEESLMRECEKYWK